jgi:hypothetical protein
MRLFTKTLSSGSITINSGDGVTQISIQANQGGSATITGNFPFKSLTSNAVLLENGESITITTPTNSPLDGVVIAQVSGDVDVVIGF